MLCFKKISLNCQGIKSGDFRCNSRFLPSVENLKLWSERPPFTLSHGTIGQSWERALPAGGAYRLQLSGSPPRPPGPQSTGDLVAQEAQREGGALALFSVSWRLKRAQVGGS